MKIWRFVVPGIVGLALAGCRTDPSIELLERDNWNKEREINRLSYENQALKKALDEAGAAQLGLSPRETPTTRSGSSLAPPARTYAEPDAPASSGIRVSPGVEAPAGEVPPTMRGQGTPPRAISPPSGPTSGGSSQWSPAGSQPHAGNSALADNSQVAQITLHPALTGGIGVSDRPGDEGLLVVVEPRDFGGNIINAPGEISVALLDPAVSGEEARLARWDFPAAQTQGLIRTGAQQGIHLRLPWKTTPAHDRLKVFVRYTTRDGRKLQAERLISVAVGSPPGQREAIPDTPPEQTASRPQWSPIR
jgi:hypothetical protein